ncbi:MAG TPA: MotA/TolQ/ExbB proton channel family protein [Gemmataceae bacterium]|nr:MotA/TolQ/ExbB proton channel family protein [Gemmataceae bacterium]
MTRPYLPTASERPAVGEHRSRANWAALVLGLPLALGLLSLIHFGPLRDSPARRYLSHPVEAVELVMFCAAFAILGVKFLASLSEQRACRLAVLPPWDGHALAVSEAGQLLAGLGQLPRRVQNSRIVKRTASVLDFLCRRGSAAELDDHLRALADTDALALEGSYALTRFITWAIPILGFLGTVLGITQSIFGITPEKLENSLSEVTDGLALAFDATALALGLTMFTMFLSFLVERTEQAVLDAADRYAERELAHRFERTGAANSEFIEVVRRQTDVLTRGVDQLMQRQTALWAQAQKEIDQRRQEAEQRLQERLTAALESALERTLETHSRRVAALDQQVAEHTAGMTDRLAGLAAAVRETGREHQTGVAQIGKELARLLEGLTRLQDDDHQLRRLQETLNQNLAALAGAGTFEQALHSLTAAVHLLTARAGTAPGSSSRTAGRPGNAA